MGQFFYIEKGRHVIAQLAASLMRSSYIFCGKKFSYLIWLLENIDRKVKPIYMNNDHCMCIEKRSDLSSLCCWWPSEHILSRLKLFPNEVWFRMSLVSEDGDNRLQSVRSMQHLSICCHVTQPLSRNRHVSAKDDVNGRVLKWGSKSTPFWCFQWCKNKISLWVQFTQNCVISLILVNDFSLNRWTVALCSQQ